MYQTTSRRRVNSPSDELRPPADRFLTAALIIGTLAILTLLIAGFIIVVQGITIAVGVDSAYASFCWFMVRIVVLMVGLATTLFTLSFWRFDYKRAYFYVAILIGAFFVIVPLVSIILDLV